MIQFVFCFVGIVCSVLESTKQTGQNGKNKVAVLRTFL